MNVANPDWHNLFKNLVWRGQIVIRCLGYALHIWLKEDTSTSPVWPSPSIDMASVDVSEVSAIITSLENLKECLSGDSYFPGC